ncbi:MAG TPA: hypothetical protein VJ997_02485 [Longimicrobiales bacterium]|nr:hypothetical protein [Longimicrobiales bacterium]
MRTTFILAFLAAAVLAIPRAAVAQELADPVLHGRVFVGDTVSRGGLVVLHRVSSETQGEVDSVAVGLDGTFSVRLPAVPDPARSEVYFASVRHAGILYFGQPINLPVQLDSVYEIHAYDTAMVAPQGQIVPVAAREIFLQANDDQQWDAVDLFQLRNDGTRTLVAREGGIVWSYPLPDGARDGTVSDMGLGAGAAEVREGRLIVTSPLPPGERMYVVRYVLDDPYVSVPLPEPTEALEILVREPAPPMKASGLQPMDPVEMEPGSAYLRFAAADLTSGQVGLERGQPASAPPVGWYSFILALALTGVGVWAVQSGASREAAPAPAPVGRQELLREVALLDEEFAHRASPSAEERGLYDARRRDLLRRIRALG